jgi:hypothetical protein
MLLLVAALAALALVSSACSSSGGLRGSGNVQTQTRAVTDFDSIEFSGLGTVTVEQSGSNSLQVQADDNILPLLTSTVTGTTLQLGVQPGANPAGSSTINYRVTVKQLRGLVLSGAGNVNAASINTPNISLGNSGAGQLTASGQTNTENVDLLGFGKIDAGALTAQDADVSVDGTATVNPARSLTATVTGVGNIEYPGSPAVTQHITGIGTVHKK